MWIHIGEGKSSTNQRGKWQPHLAHLKKQIFLKYDRMPECEGNGLSVSLLHIGD